MIELYKRGNRNYTFNGDHCLDPEKCELTMEKNGTWSLEMIHPLDKEGKYKDITEEAVLAVPTPRSDKQLFRIYECDPEDEEITAHARPIFFDAAHDTMIIDARPTNKTGQQALDIMCSGTKYSASSDIIDISTAYYENRNLIAALFGDDENSFINRWGGEPVFDNYKAIINKRAGADYGVRVEYGRNLSGLQASVNMENVVTRIYPKAYNGYTLENNGYVDSPNIGKYQIVYAKAIDYTDVKLQSDCSGDETGYATLKELRDELIRRCKKDFENGIDLPTVSMTVNMVNLSRTTEYAKFKILENVGLGDTLHVQHSKLDIETSVRVNKIVYDCINEKNISEELGDATTDCFTKMNDNITNMQNAFNSNGTVKGESIAGIIDAMQTVLRASRGIAKKQQERAILFEDLDPDSPTYGATAIGTTGWQISNKRTADNKDWVWTTAATGAGILAEYLIGKYLVSQNFDEGKRQGVKFDLINGYLKAFKMIIDTDYFKVDEDGRVSILDGYININTNSQKESHISLNSDAGEYGTYGMNLCPLSLDIKSTNQNTSSSVTAAGISAFRGSEFVLAQPNLIQLHDENGGAELTTEKLRKLLELIN